MRQSVQARCFALLRHNVFFDGNLFVEVVGGHGCDATRLGAWLQYDGSQYKRENVLGNKLSYRDHSGALGLSLTNDFEDIGTLKARLSYGMSTFNFPTLEDKGLSQSTNRVDFGLGWHSTLGAFSYNIGLDYNYFGFSKAVNDELPGLKALNENTARLSLGGLYSFDEFNNVGLDLTGAVNGVNDFAGIGSHTFAYIQASPYYLNRGKNYSVRLGIECSNPWQRWMCFHRRVPVAEAMILFHSRPIFISHTPKSGSETLVHLTSGPLTV